MWYESSIFYQIYPLGLCGAPEINDGNLESRILKLKEWIPHIKKLNMNAIYFSPVFESDRHGYDTKDFAKIDCRLGTNQDFKEVCRQIKSNGIRIVLDGVFNHVGRGFWAFQDVMKNRQDSPYCDWFYINFDGNSSFQDGFWYEGWEGHYELVKLNLNNQAVRSHIFSCIQMWIDEFDIDGLRLDVAYCLDPGFLRSLRSFCSAAKNDFLLLGEILFGDYKGIVNSAMLHSCTNYECYKGIYSSLNDMNLFEISYSLNRQFGIDNNAIYKNMHLLSFVDNHDVSRIASILNQKSHLPLAFALLFGMPGIPCIYYGSEWGLEGAKQSGSDLSLRPSLTNPKWTELTSLISKLTKLHNENSALHSGSYKVIHLTNRQLIFERSFHEETIWVGINADSVQYMANIAREFTCIDLLSGETLHAHDQILMHSYELFVWKL